MPGGAMDGDAVIVDLESTVAPDDKEKARENALTYLWEPAPPGLVRIVRINSPRSALGLRDLLALQAAEDQPDAIIIPKCESADELRLIADVLEAAQSNIQLIPMVELARAVFVVDEIAVADERVCGLFLGGGDLAADLGNDGSWENLLFARSCIVAAAATSGIASIDVPYFKNDDAGLKLAAEASRKLGMTGKAALHAEQLAAINAIFTPSTDAVTHARAVMAACTAAGTRTPVLNGHVVELAMIRGAERVLAIDEKLRHRAKAFPAKSSTSHQTKEVPVS
jgi:citrate lyase beta subunit